MLIKYTKQFLNDVAGLNEKMTKRLEERLLLFQDQPLHPLLKNHKLKGKLKGYSSINITGDMRAIFTVEIDKKDNIAQKFVRLNTHSELYG